MKGREVPSGVAIFVFNLRPFSQTALQSLPRALLWFSAFKNPPLWLGRSLLFIVGGEDGHNRKVYASPRSFAHLFRGFCAIFGSCICILAPTFSSSFYFSLSFYCSAPSQSGLRETGQGGGGSRHLPPPPSFLPAARQGWCGGKAAKEAAVSNSSGSGLKQGSGDAASSRGGTGGSRRGFALPPFLASSSPCPQRASQVEGGDLGRSRGCRQWSPQAGATPAATREASGGFPRWLGTESDNKIRHNTRTPQKRVKRT
ncbi:hypothetical protein Taro_015062 [Colocasia esculenta]|uniref:Uncharacterized protein n=1 Tax=Colocasia esculenta TaxID=4460 RepID=A0A843UKE9_COLES|nr:hypothetical protein [Colocasia esculenta]